MWLGDGDGGNEGSGGVDGSGGGVDGSGGGEGSGGGGDGSGGGAYHKVGKHVVAFRETGIQEQQCIAGTD